MGWGCYKHEIDAGSENWNTQVDKLCSHEWDTQPHKSWGRQLEICPFCVEEYRVRIKEAEDLFFKIETYFMNHRPDYNIMNLSDQIRGFLRSATKVEVPDDDEIEDEV